MLSGLLEWQVIKIKQLPVVLMSFSLGSRGCMYKVLQVGVVVLDVQLKDILDYYSFTFVIFFKALFEFIKNISLDKIGYSFVLAKIWHLLPFCRFSMERYKKNLDWYTCVLLVKFSFTYYDTKQNSPFYWLIFYTLVHDNSFYQWSNNKESWDVYCQGLVTLQSTCWM